MRLLRHGRSGAEKPGLLDAEGRIRDLSGHVDDITPVVLTSESLRRLAGLDASSLPRVEGNPRLGPPIAGVPNLVCIGLNYADHARETNSPIPEAPIVFMKHTGSIIGPNDQVRIPRGASKTDWEVELGVVIGRRASYVEEAAAMEHVAGYCIVNDVSERDFQFHGGGNQWIKGKSPDTFAPVGPWLVTKDEVHDPQNLALWLEVDGHRYQDGSTRTMIFDVAHLVSHCSRYMTLLPGDVISTGTPPGVGAGVKPNPVFLKAGNVMRLGIEGLGEQRQEVGQA
ncbi:MAG: hydrolase family protein [Geminicoccaceae bacterium]|jgi:ureidoglycolate lyase|nr:hydrolase family protein [Geminicoccaceae bacterium]